MKIIAEFICSPNREEIYDQKLIFLSNSILEDEIIYTDSVYDYTSNSSFWTDIFSENDKGVYKVILKLEIKPCPYYSSYYNDYEYDEEVFVEEIILKDKLKNWSEVRYIATQIKEQNEEANRRFD